jgi:hypothetical protein
MRLRTHQRWNHPEIIIILGTINKTMQIPNITNLITTGKNNASKIINLLPHAPQSYKASLKTRITPIHCTKHQIWIYE